MSGPPLFVVSRQRPGGRFTYTTPHWPDARRYLVDLLERHAAQAEAAEDLAVARQARAAAQQVPATPPAHPWSVRVDGCRYHLARAGLDGGHRMT